MLVLKENTAFDFSLFDKHILLQLAPLEVVDTLVAHAQPFLSVPVRTRDTRLVFRRRITAYDTRQVLRQCVDRRHKQLTVILMQRLHARIHIHIVLRHTGRQQLTVAIEDIPARGLDRFVRRHLFLRHLQPLVTLGSLDIHNLHQHGYKTERDEEEDNGKAPDRISLFVTHGFLSVVLGFLPICCRWLLRSPRLATAA